MNYYPILLDLDNCKCLVVGVGRVGLRKICGLLKAGAKRVIGLDISPPLPEADNLLASHPNFTYLQRPFEDADLRGVYLAFACTSSSELNDKVALLCARQGVLCNVADAPRKSSFVLPAVVRRGDLCMTVSTGGASPALSRKLRCQLDECYGSEYARFLRVMEEIRPAVLELGLDSDRNKVFFRELADQDFLDLVAKKDRGKLVQALNSIVPGELHSRTEEWADELCTDL